MNEQTLVPPDAFADLLPVETRRIAPGEYEMVSAAGQELFYVEGAALAEWLRDRINAAPAAPRKRTKKQQIEEDLRRSDLTAQLAQRDNIEYGPHDSLPRAEHIARFTKE